MLHQDSSSESKQLRPIIMLCLEQWIMRGDHLLAGKDQDKRVRSSPPEQPSSISGGGRMGNSVLMSTNTAEQQLRWVAQLC